MTEAPAAPGTIAELLLARADDDRPGMWFEGRTWTWRQVVADSGARARLALDLQVPDRPFHIGILLENVPEYVLWMGGAAIAGATIVGINPTRRGEELARDIRHSDCQLIVTDAGSGELLEGLDLGLPDDRVLYTDGEPYQTLIRERDGKALPDVPAAHDPSALAFLVFTSGSTGAPKAVMWSSGSVASAGVGVSKMYGITADDVNFNAMPLFHGNALKACWAPALAAGATFALQRKFSASRWLDDVRASDASYFTYVGRALSYILAQPRRPEEKDHRLRTGFGTEASMPDREEFLERFGVDVVESYGSSENGISIQRAPGMPPNALGLAPPGADVLVLDPETGQECPRAELDANGRLLNAAEAIGELASRTGPAAFDGYYKNAEASENRVRDGIFWSGDLGYRDRDGYFYFAGRGGDKIRVDSENFAAAPIERILDRIPGIAAATVYPVPDPRTGDQVMATIVLAPGVEFDPETFKQSLLADPDLGTKWAPRFVRVVPDLPLTATSKVDRGRLRRERWEGESPIWWRAAGPLAQTEYVPLTAEGREQLRAEFAAYGRLPVLDMV
jgi:fatty-acyl-CoA synthase